jgi:hypothetical protein
MSFAAKSYVPRPLVLNSLHACDKPQISGIGFADHVPQDCSMVLLLQYSQTSLIHTHLLWKKKI